MKKNIITILALVSLCTFINCVVFKTENDLNTNNEFDYDDDTQQQQNPAPAQDSEAEQLQQDEQQFQYNEDDQQPEEQLPKGEQLPENKQDQDDDQANEEEEEDDQSSDQLDDQLDDEINEQDGQGDSYQSQFGEGDQADDTELSDENPLDAFRKLMEENGIDIYVLPRTDQHKSQWLCACDQRLAFLSGFTGSNGFGAVTKDEAIVWTDGRYLTQAPKQFYPGWEVKKLGGGQQKWYDYLVKSNPQGSKVQIDGNLITAQLAKTVQKAFKGKDMQVNFADSNLVDQIWIDRPKSSQTQIFVHQEWAGQSIDTKVGFVRENIQQKKADAALFSDLTQIAWLLNLRSAEVPYTPVFKSYLLITQDGGTLFLPVNHPSMNDQQVIEQLSKVNINIQPYPLKLPKKVLCKPSQISHQVSTQIKQIITWQGVALKRGVKTEKQIQGYRKANKLDAVGMVKYWAWLKQQEEVDQYEAAQHLLSLLAQNQQFISESFPVMISGGANSALAHYFPTQKKSDIMKKDQVRFMDAGGHYLFGTTDTSRAYHFGQPTATQKQTFTRVLLGNLDVQRQEWTDDKPVLGGDLDTIARKRLREVDLNYEHGTGHGVGYYLAIHQWPVGIIKNNKVAFKEGMLVTDEPGYYKENDFGFRVQNQLIVVRNQQGNLTFQNLTLLPYDRNLIDLSLLTEQDKQYINNYHKRVWEQVSPMLEDDSNALQWLREACQQL